MAISRRVLFVDDDRDIVLAVSLRLRASGYEVAVAHDGAEGLKAALQDLPDAIILDMRLPVMDGMQVLLRLRQNPTTSRIPVVVLSASVLDRSEAHALAAGARFFVQKPYDPVRLMEALEAVLVTKTDTSTVSSAPPLVVAPLEKTHA